MGPSETFVKLSSGWLFYTQRGDGFPLCLVPAAGSSSWVWRKVLDRLAERFTVYAVDLPGYDRSETPERVYGVEDYADTVREFLDHLAIQRSLFVGNQTGAMVSLHLAAHAPNLVAKLVLVSCPGWTATEGRKVYERSILPSCDAGGVPLQRSAEEIRESVVGADPDLIAFMNSMLARSGSWNTFVHERVTSYDVPVQLPRIHCPTLLVYGEHDVQLRREDRMRQGIDGSRTAIVPGASSISFYEQPDAFLNQVMPFLEA